MTTESDRLHSVALEWMETRDVIAQMLWSFYGESASKNANCADAIIVRLSDTGYEIAKVSGTTSIVETESGGGGPAGSSGSGANGSHGCSAGGPSNIGGGGGAPGGQMSPAVCNPTPMPGCGGGGGAPSVFADAGQHMVDTAAAHRAEIAALTKKLQEAEWRLAELDR